MENRYTSAMICMFKKFNTERATKMKKAIKRTLAMLLAMMLLLCCFAAAASAEGEEEAYEEATALGNPLPLNYTYNPVGGQFPGRNLDEQISVLGGYNTDGVVTQIPHTIISDIPTKTNFMFLGWSTASGAAQAQYTAGQAYPGTAPATFYAVWKEIPKVIFQPNGGSFTGKSVNVPEEVRTVSGYAAVPAQPTKARAREGFFIFAKWYDYSFVGWADTNTAAQPAYSGSSIGPFTDHKTVWAVWQKTLAPRTTTWNGIYRKVLDIFNYQYDSVGIPLTVQLTANVLTPVIYVFAAGVVWVPLTDWCVKYA